MKTALIAYVPVLHRGYLEFFKKYAGAKLWLLSEGIIQELATEFPELSYLVKKDALRAVTPSLMRDAVAALKIVSGVEVLHLYDKEVIRKFDLFVMPDEDVMRRFYQRHMPLWKEMVFEPVFLRYHRGNVEKEKEVKADRIIVVSDFEKECMAKAFREGERSADWWRQVGGIIVKDGAPLLWAHNVHVPFPEMPYVFGDPRSMWSRGVRIELTTAEHVESVLVAEAARRGIALAGTDLYLTDFPCPPCAKLIARAGFRRLYYAKGSYTMLQGESIVRSNGAEIVRVIV